MEYQSRNILAFPWLVSNNNMYRTTGAHIDWATMQADQVTYAEFLDSETGKMVIPSGTLMKHLAGDTTKWVPIAADTDVSLLTEDWGMLEADAYEDNPNSALDNYGLLQGAHYYKNLLPDYVAGRTVLVDSINGKKGFLAEVYSDSRTA